MAKKQEKEIERWVTVNGARVPIFKDGSVGGPKALRDKIKASQGKKSTDKKETEGFVVDFDIQKAIDKKEAKRAKSHEAYMKKKQRNIEAAKKAFEAGEDTPRSKAEAKALLDKYTDKKSGSKERLSVYERQLAEVNDELANQPKSKALRNEEGIRELEKKKAQLEGYIAKEKGIKKSEDKKKRTYSLDKRDDNNFEITNPEKGTKYTVTAKNADEARTKLQKAQRAGKTDQFDFQDSDIKSLKQVASNKSSAKNETVEQAMDRLQKESRAKVDSMSAQQVMKYAKENGLRGLKTDTLAQRDDRVANHMYMQEMKKWREQKNVAENETLKEKQIAQNKAQRDERNNQVSDRVKSYQDKFLKKKSVEEIKEIQSNIEKAGTNFGYTDSDMVAMRAIENELKERRKKK